METLGLGSFHSLHHVSVKIFLVRPVWSLPLLPAQFLLRIPSHLRLMQPPESPGHFRLIPLLSDNIPARYEPLPTLFSVRSGPLSFLPRHLPRGLSSFTPLPMHSLLRIQPIACT